MIFLLSSNKMWYLQYLLKFSPLFKKKDLMHEAGHSVSALGQPRGMGLGGRFRIRGGTYVQ